MEDLGFMGDDYFEDVSVGGVISAGPYHVTLDEMVAFAEKWDPFPFHVDEAAGRDSIYGGLIASGEYTMSVKQALIHRLGANPALIGSLGYDELRYLGPVRPGDRLTLSVECTDKRESRGKADRGVVKYKVTLTNQESEPVLSYVDNILLAKRDG
jgi:acyl dehydratase